MTRDEDITRLESHWCKDVCGDVWLSVDKNRRVVL